MTEPERDLTSEEGVDQRSAASASEGDARPDPDVVGTLGHGGPADAEPDAPPDLVETDASRRAHEGQQLAAGEG